MAEMKTGVVEKVEYTHGGAGNQYTTIDGVRYVTFWDIRTRDWTEGDTVTFTCAERSLWHGQPKSLHAQNIKKVQTKAASETTRMRLILDVDYVLNGIAPQDMESYLMRACERAIGGGMLSGETEAEVYEYSLRAVRIKAPKVLVSVVTACGSIGQGILGDGKPFTWSQQPDGETVQAIFTRIDAASLDVVEVVALTGDDWRQFDEGHAEAAMLYNVANGHTMAQALECVPAGMREASA